MERHALCDAFVFFSDQEYENRFKRVREKMAENGTDVLIVHGSQAQGNSVGQVNLTYLTGYGTIQETFLVVPKDGEPTMFLTVPIHCENAAELSYIKDIRGGWPITENVVKRIKELKLEKGRIGLVGPGATSRAGNTLFKEQYDYFTSALPNAEFVNSTVWFDDLRLIKSEEELNVLRKAAAVNDLAYYELLLATRVGVEHRELQRALYGVAARHGATYSFAHACSMDAINPTSYMPEYYPTNKRIKNHSIVTGEITLGYGTTYFNKLWPCYFVGEPDKDYIRMYEVAIKVYRNLVSGLKVGMTGREVQKFLQPITDAGLEQVANTLVGGWSNMMHAPAMGAMPGTMSYPIAQLYMDTKLEKGMTITLHIWLKVPNTNKAMWLGSTGAMLDEGFVTFNKFPVDQIHYTFD